MRGAPNFWEGAPKKGPPKLSNNDVNRFGGPPIDPPKYLGAPQSFWGPPNRLGAPFKLLGAPQSDKTLAPAVGTLFLRGEPLKPVAIEIALQ